MDADERGAGGWQSRRFGDDYQRYRENVPRWLPRPKPWDPGGDHFV